MARIRVYMEGGGSIRETRAPLRSGVRSFLTAALGAAAARRVTVIACGSRGEAFKSFCRAAVRLKGETCFLLVDAEGPVEHDPWKHLNRHDGWRRPDARDQSCHLMAQTMEAWIIADAEALQRFFGRGFDRSVIPERQDVEGVPKRDLEECLCRAVKRTKKRRYHKIRHGPRLLAMIDPSVVRRRAGFCDRFLLALAAEIGS